MPTPSHPSPMSPPAAVELVLDFTNTHAGGRPEQFANSQGLRAWLGTVGFADEGATDADADDARELRSALQTLLLVHAGDEETTPAAVEAATEYLARIAVRHPLVCMVTADDITLNVTQTGALGAFASVLVGVDQLARAGVWGRVKACRNPICHEAFFDRSRNGSAIYHDAGCASMVSMRAYRQRKKSATR